MASSALRSLRLISQQPLVSILSVSSSYILSVSWSIITVSRSFLPFNVAIFISLVLMFVHGEFQLCGVTQERTSRIDFPSDLQIRVSQSMGRSFHAIVVVPVNPVSGILP